MYEQSPQWIANFKNGLPDDANMAAFLVHLHNTTQSLRGESYTSRLCMNQLWECHCYPPQQIEARHHICELLLSHDSSVTMKLEDIWKSVCGARLEQRASLLQFGQPMIDLKRLAGDIMQKIQALKGFLQVAYDGITSPFDRAAETINHLPPIVLLMGPMLNLPIVHVDEKNQITYEDRVWQT
jgi:hypothetical protein